MFPHILWTAIWAGLVVAVIAYIADYFLSQSGLGFPRQMLWLIALLVWLALVFGGGF